MTIPKNTKRAIAPEIVDLSIISFRCPDEKCGAYYEYRDDETKYSEVKTDVDEKGHHIFKCEYCGKNFYIDYLKAY